MKKKPKPKLPPGQSEAGRSLGLKEVSVHMGMFDFTVNVVIGDRKKAIEYAAWTMDDPGLVAREADPPVLPHGQTFSKTGYCPLIWVPGKPSTPVEHSTLAHECVHAAVKMMVWTGMSINEETEEVLAYAVGHMVTVIMHHS